MKGFRGEGGLGEGGGAGVGLGGGRFGRGGCVRVKSWGGGGGEGRPGGLGPLERGGLGGGADTPCNSPAQSMDIFLCSHSLCDSVPFLCM